MKCLFTSSRTALCIIALLLLAACNDSVTGVVEEYRQTPGQLSVTVIGHSRCLVAEDGTPVSNPLENVTVTAIHRSGDFGDMITATDVDGDAQLDLLTGMYDIRIEADGFEPITLEDNIVIPVALTALGDVGLAEVEDDCFPNGVAAGDVKTKNGESSVVLWARAAHAGPVEFEYGRDPDFLAPDAETRVRDVDDTNIPVKAKDISGLLPGTQYYYRACGGNCSPTFRPESESRGKFFTPHADGKNGLRFGVSSCFDGNLRPFTSIENVPERDLDFFVALGDTTYADNPHFDENGKRFGRAKNLKVFREKNELVYSQVRSPMENQEITGMPINDNYFALARASTAFYVTIDDHEVLNNFAGGATAKDQFDTPECNGGRVGPDGLKKCFCDDPDDPDCDILINDTLLFEDALQAWHEYNPIKEEVYGDTGDDRTEEEYKLYRYRTFGKDAAMFILDTRSFRDKNISFLDQDAITLPQQAYGRGRTLLGQVQLNNLLRDLRQADRDGITWKFVMVPEPIQHLGIVGAADRFEGFVYERAVILDLIETECIDNVVFISGDIHGSVVNNLAYQKPSDVLLGLGSVGHVQRFSTAWDISAGPVAYSPPIGVEVTGSTPEGDRKLNDEIFKRVMDGQLQILSRPKTGLGNDIFIVPPLQQQNKTIPATLDERFSEWSYVSVHSYGWTEFEINPTSQKLTVTSWAIPWYEKGGNGDLSEKPREVNKFVVTPARPANDGGECLFDKNCKSCRCSLFTGIGDGVLQCDAKTPNGSACAINNQCASDRCRTLICQAKEANGDRCLTNNDCKSGRCRTATCMAKEPSGNRCRANYDCASNLCTRANFFSLKRCE